MLLVLFVNVTYQPMFIKSCTRIVRWQWPCDNTILGNDLVIDYLISYYRRVTVHRLFICGYNDLLYVEFSKSELYS